MFNEYQKRKLIITSRAINTIPYINEFLGVNPANDKTPTRFAGWGRKPSGNKAVKFSLKTNSGFILLEDGFLRSTNPGRHSPPLSLVTDLTGIYYDSTQPCDLETLLNSDSNLLDGKLDKIEQARDLILLHELSKYNSNSAPFDVDPRDTSPRILLIDQTVGDLSVALGGASQTTFELMLKCAQLENPHAKIYIKTHPEVLFGRKRGYFSNNIQDQNIILLPAPINPVNLIKKFDHIYTVSSTMGFEALLAGKKVTCFGKPWYSGWGVTDDRQHIDRRSRKRSVIELFSAAYFHYAHYINPFTHELGNIFDVIDWLILQSKETGRLWENKSGRVICIGLQRWKRVHLRPILSAGNKNIVFCKNVGQARSFALNPNDQILIWGRNEKRELKQLSATSGAKIQRVEDGFIRSVGLGSDLIRPKSIVVDKSGIYFDPALPSALENILNTHHFSEVDLLNANELRKIIIDSKISKYNFEEHGIPNWSPKNKKVILVPGQVEDDASIRFGSQAIASNSSLLKAVRAENPDDYIVYKPHPDVISMNRKGKIGYSEAKKYADHVETTQSINNCIESAHEIHTMTSLCGFDALLRNKKVVTFGMPFYAGWGLTEDRNISFEVTARRHRRLSLDELIAGTLLYYPVYWDWTFKGYTDCLSVVRQIVSERNILEQTGELKYLEIGFIRRQVRKIHALISGLVDFS